jgi:hypothetical protein
VPLHSEKFAESQRALEAIPGLAAAELGPATPWSLLICGSVAMDEAKAL